MSDNDNQNGSGRAPGDGDHQDPRWGNPGQAGQPGYPDQQGHIGQQPQWQQQNQQWQAHGDAASVNSGAPNGGGQNGYQGSHAYPGESAQQAPYGQPQNPNFAHSKQQNNGAWPNQSQGQPPRKTGFRAYRKWFILGGVALVVVIALIIATVGFFMMNRAAADNTVDRVMHAIVKGDADAVKKVVPMPTGASAALLKTSIAQKATQKVQKYRIANSATQGSHKIFRMNVTQQGLPTYSVLMELEKNGKDGLFDKWRVSRLDLPKLRLTVAAPEDTEFTVNGVTLPKTDAVKTNTTYLVLPGQYDFALAKSSTKYYAMTNSKSSVMRLGYDTGQANLATSLNDAGKQKADEAVRAYVESCVAITEAITPECNFAINTGGTQLTDIHWAKLSDPTWTFSDVYRDGRGWRVTTTTDGSVHFTAKTMDGGSVEGAGDIPLRAQGYITKITDDGAEFVSQMYS